jgi:hypothetical protein
LSQPESDSNEWREPIIKYIKNEEEPNDKAAAECIARQSTHYTLIGDALYRRGIAGVLMKCIPSVTGKQLLDEIHAGQCGIHAASRTLVGKVFRSGFYCPTTKSDAAKLVQRCEACQFLSKQQHLPTQQLQNTSNMAICMLGTGHDWTLQESSGRCWGPSASEGPQKHDLTMFLEV